MDIEHLVAERRRIVDGLAAAACRLFEIDELLAGETLAGRERARIEAGRASMIVEIESLSERLIELAGVMWADRAREELLRPSADALKRYGPKSCRPR